MEHGGVLNCISNDGNTLISDDKYIWSQGRWLYIMSELIARRSLLRPSDYEKVLQSAELTAAFLIEHSFDSKGQSVFITERDGSWIRNPDGEYHMSVYADCFIIIGLASYASVTGCSKSRDTVLFLIRSLEERVADGHMPTAPYGIPEGFESHGIPMILSNVFGTAAGMLESFREDSSALREHQQRCISYILSRFYDTELGLVHEYWSAPGNDDTLLCRHINPGHVLEDAWFWLDGFESRHEVPVYSDRISSIIKDTYYLAWDREYGGLLRFIDENGGKPCGRLIGDGYEELVLSTWDMKLWWPHSEMLYLFLRMYSITGDKEYIQMYETVRGYSFSVFPSPDNGEWNQIRTRDGSPEDRVVALPVKDPFHILRDFIRIIDLAEVAYADNEC